MLSTAYSGNRSAGRATVAGSPSGGFTSAPLHGKRDIEGILQWMKDYTYRREYEGLEEEFSGVAALIDARNRSVLEE